VGAAIAAGSQEENGSWALLVEAVRIRITNINAGRGPVKLLW
jgi:hypothetical protein